MCQRDSHYQYRSSLYRAAVHIPISTSRQVDLCLPLFHILLHSLRFHSSLTPPSPILINGRDQDRQWYSDSEEYPQSCRNLKVFLSVTIYAIVEEHHAENRLVAQLAHLTLLSIHSLTYRNESSRQKQHRHSRNPRPHIN